MRVSAVTLCATGERRQHGWRQLAAINYERDDSHHRVGSAEQNPALYRGDRELHDEQAQQRTGGPARKTPGQWTRGLLS
jgi:hypothetical protein